MIKTYWWDARYPQHNPAGIYNFGDQLTHTLLNHYGIEHEWATRDDAELVMTGSVLEHMPCCWPGKVVGTGALFETSSLHMKHTDFLAVRGPLTVKTLNGAVPSSVALGDPGLLASDLIAPRSVFHDLGVVPHWSDDNLAKRYAYGYVISPRSGPMYVMEQIVRCRRIVTSSLHGMIVADSLGIPRQVEMFDRAYGEGGDFKFRDYAASIGDTPRFGEMVTADQNQVARRKAEIRDALAQV